MIKLLSITVNGKKHDWSFQFYGDPKHIKEWEADGLQVDEICNIVPMWVVNLGLVSQWCWLQDVFNFNWRSK